MESNTDAIVRWVAQLQLSDIPADVVDKTRQCLIDFVAVAFGGSRSDAGRIATDVARGWGGSPESVIIGGGVRVAARNAAFANAVAANALDYDDTLYGHPGATTFPVVLALGERVDASGADVVAATVVGYEVAVRALALMVPVEPRFEALWDLGTLQTLGAAAAACRVVRLNWRQTQQVLGLAAATAPSPLPRKDRARQGPRSMLKSSYGWSVSKAIEAVDLVQAGFTGPRGALDEPFRFWDLTPDDKLDVDHFGDALGEKWSILQTEFKPYMACRFLHPSLEALDQIMSQHNLTAEEIDVLTVKSFALTADEHHWIRSPRSVTDAQFSVPYALGALAVLGALDVDAYSATRLTDARIRRLTKRMRVEVDRRYDEAYPQSLGARVDVVTTSGESISAQVDTPRGSVARPMSNVELRQKYRDMTQPLLGERAAEELLDSLDALEHVSARDLASQLV